MIEIPLSTARAIARLLVHSFRPIHFDYNGLTVEEEALLTREDFVDIVAFSDSVLAAATAEKDKGTELDTPLWNADLTVQDLQSGYSGKLGVLYTLLEKLWCGNDMERFHTVRCGSARACNSSADGNGRITISLRFPLPEETKTIKFGKDWKEVKR